MNWNDKYMMFTLGINSLRFNEKIDYYLVSILNILFSPIILIFVFLAYIYKLIIKYEDFKIEKWNEEYYIRVARDKLEQDIYIQSEDKYLTKKQINFYRNYLYKNDYYLWYRLSKRRMHYLSLKNKK